MLPRGADIVSRHLNGAYLQRLLINADVDFPPEAALGTAVLACVPLTFSLGLDPGQLLLAATRGDQQV